MRVVCDDAARAILRCMTKRGTTRCVGMWAVLAALGGCATPTPVALDAAKVREEPAPQPDAAGDAATDATVDAPTDAGAPSDAMDADAPSPDADAPSPDADAPLPDADAPLPDVDAPELDADVAPPDAACPVPLTLCGAVCVDVSTDRMHCGGCGVACPRGTVCAGGECGAPRIHALHPPLVDGALGRIVLEGAFGTTASVTFPGVMDSMPATVLGPGRIAVSVPSNTTAGALRVNTEGATATSPVRFRRASFSLGLQPFRARYEQADYARQTPSLTTARVHAATFQSGLWLYLLGGADASGAPLNSIERAMINADGTLGAFQTTSATLGAQREGAAAVRVGDRVYLIGGARGTRLGTIERATVGADGVLDAFAPWSGGMVRPRSGHVAEVIGGYVYVFGGGSTVVERAPIQADGMLGDFADTGLRTLEGRGYATSQVVDGNVYLLGGMNGDVASRTIERAEVRGNGAVTPFAMAGMLQRPRAGAASVVLGDKVFVAGGTDGATALRSVERADIGAEGTLSGFASSEESTLSVARHGASAAQVGNYWYLVGGAGSEPLRGIDRAEVNVSGDLGAQQAPRGLASPRILQCAMAIGRHVYVVGGHGASPTELRRLERAELRDDGSLGEFMPYAVTGAGEVGERGSLTCAITGSFLHLLPGRYGSTYHSTRMSLPIRDDGSLGDATVTETGFNNVASRAAVIDDRLCVPGGYNDVRTSDQIYCAQILAGGSLGGFTALPSVALPEARYYNGVVVLGDSLFLVGGNNGVREFSTVVRCTLGAGGIVGCVPDRSALSQARYGALSNPLLGNRLLFIGGARGPTGLSTIERVPVASDGSLGSGAPDTSTSLLGARRYHSALVLENRLWLIGGDTGDPSSAVHANLAIDLR